MARSPLGYQFTLNQAPVSVDVASRLNIKKRREQVVYRVLSNQDNINIAYLLGQDISPTNNVFISDRSTSLTQNRIPSVTEIRTIEGDTINSNVDQFLITDVFTEETATLPATPLFFVHTLKNFNETVIGFENKILLSIEFADYNLQPILISDVSIESSTGKIYNNIDNAYSSSTREADITFIKYTVKTDTAFGQQIDLYREVVDNEAIFTQATFDDIDDLGNILPGRKKYILNEVSGEEFEIVLPISATYAFQETQSSRIKILNSTASDATFPWNVRVTNGQFITSLPIGEDAFQSYKYRIAEFNSQTFQPFPPYKLQLEEQATRITSSIVKVAKNIVYNESIALFTEVLVFDRAENLKFVYSNNEEKIGDIYSTTSFEYDDGILSIDRRNGFLELEGPILEDDKVLVTYYTEEKEYAFTSIDFNPINNLDILNQRVVVYISPESVQSGDLDRTLYYLIINSLGEILYSSQAAENSDGIDPATQRLLSDDFNSDGTPKHLFYYDAESSEEGLSSRVSGVNLEFVDEFSFIDKYTVESVLLRSTVIPSGTAAENYTDNNRFLVLADIYVGEHQDPYALSVSDVRRQGGGIKKDFETTALADQPEVSWYWDFNWNQPYPGMGAFLVEVPLSITQDFGGRFTRNQITDIVRRHMKLGGYAIVQDYDINPVITSAIGASGLITFCWPSYGDDTTYNTYMGTDLGGPFTKQSSDDIVDVSSGNCFTISGLLLNKTYYVYVEATKNEIDSRGQIVGITTTATEGA